MLAPKNNTTNTDGLKRRSVVKGAVWATPVIAAAVAAPVAAASPRTASVAFSAPVATTWSNWDNTGSARNGSGPAQFSITNTAGAIASGITGTLVVVANTTPTSGLKAKGLGIATITGGSVLSRTPAVVSADPGLRADTVTSTFSLTGGVASGAILNVPLTFGYQPSSGAQTPNTYTGTFTATLTLFSGNVQIGSSAQVVLSKHQ